MGKSKARKDRIPKARPEKHLTKSAKKNAKKQKLRNRRGELLDSEKAAKLERDGFQRREKLQRELLLKRCLKQVEKLTAELTEYREPAPNAEELAWAFKERKKARLYGGARPWASREKSKHGCGYDVYECMDHCGDWENEPQPQDLLSLHHGSLTQLPATQPYCKALLELGRVQSRDDNTAEAGIATFKALLEADTSDQLGARFSLLSAFMDGGRLGEARALLGNEGLFPAGRGGRTARELYSLTLVEYIAWRILAEEDASEEVAVTSLKAALHANPFVAAFIGWNDAFREVVNPEEDFKHCEAPVDGKVPARESRGVDSMVEEALQYCITDIAVWADADGAADWVCEHITADPELEEALLGPLGGGEESVGGDDDDGKPSKALELYRAVYATDCEGREEEEGEDEEEEGMDGEELLEEEEEEGECQ